MKTLWRFLGSVYLAIFLILAAAVSVAYGTWIESVSDSHLQAAKFVYNHPLFTALLWLFFVNIAVSTIQRYPFRKRHIPFLITHAGLLMILAGALVKAYFGLQGSMLLIEGSGSSHALLPNTYAILRENYEKQEIIPISFGKRGFLPHSNLTIEGFYSHSENYYEYWVKGNHLSFWGQPPIPLNLENPRQPLFQFSDSDTSDKNWNVFAFHTNDSKTDLQLLLEESSPFLAFIHEDQTGKEFIATQNGITSFSPSSPPSVIAYDRGFSGYSVEKTISKSMHLECPLTQVFKVRPPPEKLEDMRPLITLKMEKEILPLSYDPTATSWKWPSSGGQFLFRFQPEHRPLPFHVRLKDARKITFPGSSQPFSFEADLLVSGLNKENEEEITLSLNYVHETWDGYRLYLANIHPGDEGLVQQVHLVVNYDPAKYFLTYPGGLVLALGMILLFWVPKTSRFLKD